MISDAVGKILGMAMAYGVSVLGLFLAYVNYRRRIVKAERVMTPVAWAVMAATVLGIVGGVLIVASLAESPPAEGVKAVAEPEPPAPAIERPQARERAGSRWPLIGMVLPAAIFLLATWITAGLYRHFSRAGH